MFKVQLVTSSRVHLVLDFHHSHAGQYLWPKTLEDLQRFAEDGLLYELTLNEVIIGCCYISADNKPEGSQTYEYGGVFLLPEYRNQGLAGALGKICIANLFVTDTCSPNLIAHVHQDNNDPRSLLQALGFEYKETIQVPIDKAPSNMPSKDGFVYGDEFNFNMLQLAKIADWLEGFSGSVKESPLDIDIALIKANKPMVVRALREICKAHGSEPN